MNEKNWRIPHWKMYQDTLLGSVVAHVTDPFLWFVRLWSFGDILMLTRILVSKIILSLNWRWFINSLVGVCWSNAWRRRTRLTEACIREKWRYYVLIEYTLKYKSTNIISRRAYSILLIFCHKLDFTHDGNFLETSMTLFTNRIRACHNRGICTPALPNYKKI